MLELNRVNTFKELDVCLVLTDEHGWFVRFDWLCSMLLTLPSPSRGILWGWLTRWAKEEQTMEGKPGAA